MGRKRKSSMPKKNNRGGDINNEYSYYSSSTSKSLNVNYNSSKSVDKRRVTQNINNDNRSFIVQTNIDNSITSIEKLNLKVKETKNSFSLLSMSMGEAGENSSSLLGDISKYTDVAKSIYDIGTSVENARNTFITLTGSVSEAKQIIDQTFADAETTPFDFESLAKSNQLLMAAGECADTARQHVLDLGKAVVGAGGSNTELLSLTQTLQNVGIQGKASIQDLNEFAVAGIDIYGVLNEYAGITPEKVATIGVSYNELTGALQAAGAEGGVFANTFDQANNTAAGQVGNLKDKLFELASKMFTDLQPAIINIVTWLGVFVEWAGKLWTWVSQDKELLAFLVETIASVVGIVMAVRKAIQLWAGAQAFLNLVMNMSPLGLVLIIIGGLILLIQQAWKHSETFRGIVVGLWEAFKTLASFLKDAVMKQLGAIGDILVGIFTFDKDRINKGLEGFSSVDYAKMGGIARDGFNKGWDKGHEELKTDLLDPALGNPNGATGTGAEMAKQCGNLPNLTQYGQPQPSPTRNTETEKVTGGPKQILFDIKIENLVREFKIYSTNISQSADEIKNLVTRALLDATNDSQLAEI